MIVVGFVIGLVCVAAGLLLFALALRGVPAVVRTVRRATRPIGKLDAGGVEVVGVVRPAGEPLLTLSGQPAVAVSTLVQASTGTGKNNRFICEEKVEHAVPTYLEDASGRCQLDLAFATILGETRQASLIDVALVTHVPWLAKLVPETATRLTIVQTFVPVGARVLVTATADSVGAQPGQGYRDAALQWRLFGTADDVLVISLGSEARFLARATLPLLGLLVVSTYLVAVGALILGVTVV